MELEEHKHKATTQPWKSHQVNPQPHILKKYPIPSLIERLSTQAVIIEFQETTILSSISWNTFLASITSYNTRKNESN